MSASRNEITDPNLADLPPEAFDEIVGSPTEAQLEARIRIKREAAMQDSGQMQSPHHSPDIEPIEPPAEEDTATDDNADELDANAVVEPDDEDTGEDTEADPADDDGEETDEDDFFVARYKTREAAESAIQEKDKTIAQLFRERHERETAQQQTQPDKPQLDVENWQEWAAEQVGNGAGTQGALAALEQGGPQGYDIYVAAWLQSDDDRERAEAIAFNNEVQRQFAAISAQQAVQPQSQQVAPNDEAKHARDLVAQRFPDFDQYQETMDSLVQSDDSPLGEDTKAWLAQTAREGGVQGKTLVWEYLYNTARATRGPLQAKAAETEKRRRKTSGDAAKIAATVSSSEGGAARTPLSEAELSVIRKRNGIRGKAGLPLLPEE